MPIDPLTFSFKGKTIDDIQALTADDLNTVANANSSALKPMTAV